jgi:hypothetical protein
MQQVPSRRLFLLLAAGLGLFALACGGGDDGDSGGAVPTAAIASPTPAGQRAVAEDPAGDCLSSANAPIACQPAALDLRRFTVEKDAAGNYVATVEISGGGFPTLGAYTLLIGIDVDRNATTGSTGYAGFHGLAPEIELAYLVREGQPPASQLRMYGSDGRPTGLGDASLIEWRTPEPTRIQAVLKPAGLANVTSFWIVTDLQLSGGAGAYDHIPDNARLAFPEGSVLP